MDWTWSPAVGAVVLNNLVLFFWKPWAQSYAGEKGKTLARREDLDEILAEVRAVTATQKQIEARISGEAWERQWRFNKKADVYLRLFECFEKTHARLTTFYLNGAKAESLQPFMDDINALRAEFQVWVLMARVFLPNCTSEVLHDIVNDGLAVADMPECKESLDLLRRRRRELVQAAQQDFGVTPTN